MFFREKKSRQSRILQLVENYRDNRGKVHQRIVVSLGGLNVPDEYRKAVALEVSHRMAGYQRLFMEDPVISHWVSVIISKLEAEGKLPAVTCRQIRENDELKHEKICVDEIDHERSTLLGPLLVLREAWRSLGLDDYLKSIKLSPNRIATAQALVFNRLIDPCSENELINWLQTTSVGDLTGYNTQAWGEDRFYRIGDKLFSMKAKLEKHLREEERNLFDLNRTVLLYDLTNSYFEGQAENNTLAKRSVNSKEKRSDCPLISVGLVLDADGFVITHKVFAGNIGDCKTLIGAVEDLQGISGSEIKPTVVVDGGIATRENLRILKEKGFDYVVNGKRQNRSEFAEDFARTEEFTKVTGRGTGDEKRPVFVRRIKTDDEIIVLCRSEGRYEKENAIRNSAEKKLLEGLEKLAARIKRNDPRLKLSEGAAMVNRSIGSLTKRSTRASKFYIIDYKAEKRELFWIRNEEKWSKSGDLHGCYHLRSSIDLRDEELWKLYITLTKVENAFRNMKSQLGLHPFYHQLDRRCEVHVWVTILAYHLLHWVEYTMESLGYTGSWRKILRILSTHCYTTLIIPTDEGLEYRIRKPGKPDKRQELIYDILKIDYKSLPRRKRIYTKTKHA